MTEQECCDVLRHCGYEATGKRESAWSVREPLGANVALVGMPFLEEYATKRAGRKIWTFGAICNPMA